MLKRKFKSVIFVLTAALLVTVFACNPARQYEKEEKDAISTYLSRNPNYQKQESGLYYWETLAGTGLQPVSGDTVSIWYTGKYTNGNTFDTNEGKILFTFPIGDVSSISGLQEGMCLMKEGGKATLLLPSNLAYGTTGYYIIPGYTPLVFDVQLVKVVRGSK